MRIQIKCRVSGLKINNAQEKSIDVNICDELRVCNTIGGWGVDVGSQQPVFFPSQKLTIKNAKVFFDFISAHAKETFIITLEQINDKSNGLSDVNNGDLNAAKSEPESIKGATVIAKNDVYRVVEVELIYG